MRINTKMDKTFKTINSYNHCAGEFVEKHMDLGIYKRFFQEFSDSLKMNSSILDLGCGPGNVAKFLVEQNKDYKIIGFDLSTVMLELAQQNAPTEQFVLGDIRHLILKQKFDAVIISFCLIHLDDNEAKELLSTTYGLLNANGFLYLSFMSGGRPGFEKASFSEEVMFFNYFCLDDIGKTLMNLGFAIMSKHFHEYLGKNGRIIQDVIIIARK